MCLLLNKISSIFSGFSKTTATPSLPKIPQNGRPPSPPSANRPKSGNQTNGRQRTAQSSTRRPGEPAAKSTPSIVSKKLLVWWQHICAHFSKKLVHWTFHSIHLRAYFSQVNVTIALIVFY